MIITISIISKSNYFEYTVGNLSFYISFLSNLRSALSQRNWIQISVNFTGISNRFHWKLNFIRNFNFPLKFWVVWVIWRGKAKPSSNWFHRTIWSHFEFEYISFHRTQQSNPGKSMNWNSNWNHSLISKLRWMEKSFKLNKKKQRLVSN